MKFEELGVPLQLIYVAADQQFEIEMEEHINKHFTGGGKGSTNFLPNKMMISEPFGKDVTVSGNWNYMVTKCSDGEHKGMKTVMDAVPMFETLVTR